MRNCFARDRFFYFDVFPAEKSVIVENYWFLKNCSIDMNERSAAFFLFDTRSAENIKSAKIKILKNRFIYQHISQITKTANFHS